MSDQAAASDLRPLLDAPSRRILPVLVLPLILVGSCAAGAWLWANLEEPVETPESREDASTMRLSLEDRASLFEIKWAQQKASDEITELNRRIDAQRKALKDILDQISPC
ncbi:hypothetical protein [Bradyrhizobium sp. CCBAU 45384]|uniref:hypothetical protein n=1 Tax=Bradyrhizobium sp. CCBAU 45384 TaxID=858428 RepID=UPI00230598D7|nr:hypothetical protein [Bradyrhizobium sp. CCBAU 45384]